MKLEKVILDDIRQFVGKQTLDLATQSPKKVTLIHGPNTSGKTTLLNAIHWCFYGEFVAGFKEPARLKSEEGKSRSFSVEVQFEHRGMRYIALRKGDGSPEAATLTVLEVRNNGQTVPHPQPELLINFILPQRLAAFFFFAGEMILKGLSSGTYQKEATEAIRSVLGLKLAEQGIEDLKDLRKKKQKELQLLSAGTDLARISSELSEAEQFIESRTEQLIAQRELVTQLETQKREIFEKLRGLESSSALQQRRDKVHAQLENATQALDRAKGLRQQLIPDIGYAIFFENRAKEVSSLIDDAVTKKRIPSPFDKTFVQDILKSGTCVCDRPIIAGSAEYRAVSTLINNATDETTLRRALAIRGVAERVNSVCEGAQRGLRNVLMQLADAQAQVERLEQDDARIRDLLQKHAELNVRDLENSLERQEGVLRDLLLNKRRSEEAIEEKRAVIIGLRTELERAKAASPHVADARTGLEVIELLIASLQDELDRVERLGIEKIADALNRVVGSATRQKYAAEVTPDYLIKLYKSDNGDDQTKRPVHVLSDGEQRLLDLCFMSALVSVCREREAESDAILLPGAVAPLVVDAPFGQLDPEYQALAARTMMDLSDQLVLMLSKTHWTREVDTAIRPNIGREYLLVGYRQGPAKEAAKVQIEVNNRGYELMVYNSDINRTELVEI